MYNVCSEQAQQIQPLADPRISRPNQDARSTTGPICLSPDAAFDQHPHNGPLQSLDYRGSEFPAEATLVSHGKVSDDWELGAPSASHHEANSVTNPIKIRRTAESKPGRVNDT